MKKKLIGSLGKTGFTLVRTRTCDDAMKKRDFSTAKNKIIEKPDSFSDSTDKMVRKIRLVAK
jgi:hypothetical protein